MPSHVAIFWELVRTPFLHLEMVWGIVPLYFGWLTNELTSDKASYRTALQTGFSFTWAGANWMYHYLHTRPRGAPALTVDALFAVNVFVTVLVIVVGVVALVSGIRKKYPAGASFLGHSRFANYFMILIFPMQAGYLPWTWSRLAAIGIFAVPVWLVMHFGLKPLRGKQ